MAPVAAPRRYKLHFLGPLPAKCIKCHLPRINCRWRKTRTVTDGYDLMSRQTKKVSAEALTCAFFGGPSGGRTLDLGIKSLERAFLANELRAKLQVAIIAVVPDLLKRHWRTDIYGYSVMHKAPLRQVCRGGASAYGLSMITWSPSSSRYGVIAMPRALSTTM